MKMKREFLRSNSIPVLVADLECGEADVAFPTDWIRRLDGLMRADLLKDWIGVLQTEYDNTDIFDGKADTNNNQALLAESLGHTKLDDMGDVEAALIEAMLLLEMAIDNQEQPPILDMLCATHSILKFARQVHMGHGVTALSKETIELLTKIHADSAREDAQLT